MKDHRSEAIDTEGNTPIQHYNDTTILLDKLKEILDKNNKVKDVPKPHIPSLTNLYTHTYKSILLSYRPKFKKKKQTKKTVSF